MERLSALDAGFWEFEDEHAALHIGALAIFDGPPPTPAELSAQYLRAVERTPRYRQRMQRSWHGLRRPVWADDPTFDLTFHLRRTALATPAETPELERLVGRLMTTHLDPARPLWEAWVIEGLHDDRWALVLKLHHSLVDGVGGMAMFTDLLSAAGVQDAPAAHVSQRTITGDVRAALGALPATLRGLLGYLPALRPTEPNSLTGPLGAPRRYRTVTVELAEIAAVRAALGGTVNDVALAMVTAGFRESCRRGRRRRRRPARRRPAR